MIRGEKGREYTIALVTRGKANNQFIIRHFLLTESYPLEGDYVYIFKGKGTYIGITFRGEYSWQELKAIAHKMCLEDFKYYAPTLIEFIGKDGKIRKVYSRKGIE